MSKVPDWFSSVDKETWLEAARSSYIMKEAVEKVGVSSYPNVFYYMKRRQLPLWREMEYLLGENRPFIEIKGRIDTCNECGRNVRIKARKMCSTCYNNWLDVTPKEFKSNKRADYPEDDVLVEWFKELRRPMLVARRIGVDKSSLRSYLGRRPELLARCKEFWGLPKEVVEQREREAKARWRRNNRERRRESNRKWASNRSKEDVNKWNTYNRERRKAQLVPLMSVEEALWTREYLSIISNDPCVFCGGVTETRDHIVPIMKEGSESWDNAAPACKSCNSSKRDKSLLEFLLWRKEQL